MGVELQDVVKVSAGLVLSAAASHYLWKTLAAASAQDGRRCPPKAAVADAHAQGAKGGARPGGCAPAGGPDPEEGVWIYFGSQSGTAEGFARELGEEARGQDLKATVVDMEDFEPEQFRKHRVVICVVATYGEGDPTDNAAEFFKWIKDDSLGAETLKGLRFCVMGLGNRQYANFNSCGKMANEHLARLGATRIYDLGEGDDNENIEEDFEQWKDGGLWAALQEASGGSGEQGDTSPRDRPCPSEQATTALPLRVEVRKDAADLPADPSVKAGGADVLGKWYFQAHQAVVAAERELRQVSDFQVGKSTKHIDVDVASIPAMDWQTADNLEVLPRNPEETVAWFAERLGVQDDLDCSLAFVCTDDVGQPTRMPFPTPCTIRDALGLYCDLCQAPSRQAAKRFAPFIQDRAARAAFLEIVEDRPAYQWLTGEGIRVSFRELFELFFESSSVDLGAFLQLCPRQRSRPYTIASSSREDRNTIGLCVSVATEGLQPFSSVVEQLSGRGHVAPGAQMCLERLGSAAKEPRVFWGACSSMLCGGVSAGDRLWISSRSSTFRLPREVTAPVVMIGAGTGVAPFRGFVREFGAEGGVRQKTVLFFGCARSSEDFLYKDELEASLSLDAPCLGELVTAFSREQEQKVYVQHRLRERATAIAALVEEGAHVYVCGATAMGAAIRQELSSALGGEAGLAQMQAEGRFVEELW